jgi:nanoRNase/pAp phosphatase (c-di-AMP/oligoRNAs hydrolase)
MRFDYIETKMFILYILHVMVLDLVQILAQPSYGKVIVPHTPYDLDGVCSAYALGKVLSNYGHEVKVWLPHEPSSRFMQIINDITTNNEHPLLHVGCTIEEQEMYNQPIVNNIASDLLNNYKVIMVDKNSPEKLFSNDDELRDAFIRTLELFGKQGDLIVIDHHEVDNRYEGVLYYVKDQYCANSFWMFEIITAFLKNVNGSPKVDCSIFSLLAAGILSDTLLLRSCDLSADEYKNLYKLSHYLERCGDSLGRIMDIVSSYHKNSLYYDLYELARRKVYTNRLVPDLIFVVLSAADIWTIFEAYSVESISDYVGSLAVDLLSEFGKYNAVCMLFEDIRKGSTFIAINAKKHIDLTSLRRSLGARGRKNYCAFYHSGSLDDVVGHIVSVWRSYNFSYTNI